MYNGEPTVPSGAPAGTSAEDAWAALRTACAECMRELDEDDCIVLSHKFSRAFAQVMNQGAFGVRAETVSDQFLSRTEELTERQEVGLLSLGWKSPTYILQPGEREPADGSPNYYIDVPIPVDCHRVAEMMIGALRDVYGVRHPGELQYSAFNVQTRAVIRFPTLRLKHEQ